MEEFDDTFIEDLDSLPAYVPPSLIARECKVCGGRLCTYNPNDYCLYHTNDLRDQQEQEALDEEIAVFVAQLNIACEAQNEAESREYLIVNGLGPRAEDMMPVKLLMPTLPVSGISESIVKAVCIECAVSLQEILAQNRTVRVALSRHILMYLLRYDANLSFPQISIATGRKDHTTSMHGVKKVEEMVATDLKIADCIQRIRFGYRALFTALS